MTDKVVSLFGNTQPTETREDPKQVLSDYLELDKEFAKVVVVVEDVDGVVSLRTSIMTEAEVYFLLSLAAREMLQ